MARAKVQEREAFRFANQPIPGCEEPVEARESEEAVTTESREAGATESRTAGSTTESGRPTRPTSQLEGKRPLELASGIARGRETPREERIAIMEHICCLIAGGQSLSKICNQPGMPDRVTVLRWCGQDPEIAMLYRSGLAMRAELYADQIMEMADEARGKSSDEVQALKLMVNSRQWVASRLLPKMYGDHQTVEHTGEVQLNADQIDQRLAILVKKMAAVEVKG